ncbi:hypothetical protein C2845_PM03G28660 [Panicum miliaceum]|uniref:Protein kinase domain-containing protein n=1 Tax=Panicum miliaceum TaxID=4540 RepID=A0A3L6T8R3_PANMI|nr:hypothetical protein C2845_PM03G28660 [Panicum miliaceum]
MPGLEEEQFQNELNNLVRLQHQNIVPFVSYCYEIQKKLVKYSGKLVLADKIYRLLCFEYMQNGNLGKYLSDEHYGLDWHTRYAIIKGICMGLKYLHEELNPPIYHLDLKPANVLLDEKMVPKIADFGLSRLFGEEQTRITKSSMGTLGYLPPEYIESSLISKKFNIFSLAVVIIKIMTGPTGHSKSFDMSPQQFIEIVHENWRNRLQASQVCMPESSSKQVKRRIKIALSCLETDRRKRPSIGDIVQKLNETEMDQGPVPNAPALHKRKERTPSGTASDVNSHAQKHGRMRTSENSSLPRNAAPTSANGSRYSGGGVEEDVSENSSPPPAAAPLHTAASDICSEVYERLVQGDFKEALVPEFREQLEAHFARLPMRFYRSSPNFMNLQQRSVRASKHQLEDKDVDEITESNGSQEGAANEKIERGSWSASTSTKLLPFQEEDYVSDTDKSLVKIVKKVASESCGNMFHGTYFGEDVAINVLNSKNLNQKVWNEFKQEFNKLRELHHANVIRLIDSCTRPPCIITEWISGGNVLDFLHNEHNVLDLPMLVKFALDVVKVVNFGLVRFHDQEGVVTAETATYRWMAPEVINNQAYGTKADVYSFAIVLWELMTSKIPYDIMTPLQAAAGVIEELYGLYQGLRPQLPAKTHPGLANLMQRCWNAIPSARPSFSDIVTELEGIQAHAQPSATSTITAILGNIDITGDRPEIRGSLPQALTVAFK